MDKLRQCHSSTRLFLLLIMCVWLVGIVILFVFRRGDLVFLINRHSVSWLDKPILVLTETGHGTFGTLLALLILVFVSIRKGAVAACSLILVSVFTNLGKRLLFFQHDRPMMEFGYADFDRVIFDAPITFFRSFPSGHTMMAFGLAATLAFLFRKKWASILFFLWALTIGISRIYLCQHYFVDALWGMLFGVFAGILSMVIMQKYWPENRWPIVEMSTFGLLRKWINR